MNKSYFLSILAALLTLTASAVFAQPPQPYRFEQEVKNSEQGFTVISLKQEGLALIRDSEKYSRGKKKWQLEIVDTTLSKIWSTDLELDSRYVLVGYEYNPGHVYLLFREGEASFYNFQLLTASFYDKTYQLDNVKFELNFKMSHFTMAGSSAVFGGNINNEPAVLLYDRSSEHPKVLPGLFTNDIALLDVRTNQNQSFNVLLVELKGKEKRRLILRTYDHEGNLLVDDEIDVDPNFTILAGITSTLERDEMIIAGTYGERNSKQAIGFFSVLVDPFHDQPVSYRDFTSFEHFLDYQNPRKAAKIKTKAQKQRTMGRLPDYRAYVAPLRLDERKDGFYLLTELYYPSTSINPYPAYSYYNPYAYGYYPYGLSPFSSRYYNSPYQYNSPARNSSVQILQTMVVKLNAHGKPEKDVSMKLDDVKQAALEQVSDFTIANDSIILVYKKEDEIFYQREVGDPDEKPVIHRAKVKLKSPMDVLKNEDDGEGVTRHWYDNRFYVWGYQKITDGTREEDQTRHVFYVNCIQLE